MSAPLDVQWPDAVKLCKKRRRRGKPQMYEVWRWRGTWGVLLDGAPLTLEMATALGQKRARELGLPFVPPEQPLQSRRRSGRTP